MRCGQVLPAAAQAPKIPTWRASKRCGQAARSRESTEDSQVEGFLSVRAGCPQQRAHPIFRIRRRRGRVKAVRACYPQQRLHPRFPIGKLEGGAGRLPAAAKASKIPSQTGRLEGGAGWLHAAANAARERTQGSQLTVFNSVQEAPRSSEGTQDSQLESFKAVRAGCPQQRTHEGGAGRLPAAAKAFKIPKLELRLQGGAS